MRLMAHIARMSRTWFGGSLYRVVSPVPFDLRPQRNINLTILWQSKESTTATTTIHKFSGGEWKSARARTRATTPHHSRHIDKFYLYRVFSRVDFSWLYLRSWAEIANMFHIRFIVANHFSFVISPLCVCALVCASPSTKGVSAYTLLLENLN